MGGAGGGGLSVRDDEKARVFPIQKKTPKNRKFKNPKNIVINQTIRKQHTKFGNPRPNSCRDMMYLIVTLCKKLSVFPKKKNTKKLEIQKSKKYSHKLDHKEAAYLGNY